jgi:hypothetical protein
VVFYESFVAFNAFKERNFQMNTNIKLMKRIKKSNMAIDATVPEIRPNRGMLLLSPRT